MAKRKELNGANLVVRDGDRRFLVHKEFSRLKLWMLPGGGVERGELPRHAAQSEADEETGALTDDAGYRLIGYFAQKPSGIVFLYEDLKPYDGDLITEPNDESAEACFMSLGEIVKHEKEFRTSTLRMILRYMRCVAGIDKIPYEGRLADIVEYPSDLDLERYKRDVLRV